MKIFLTILIVLAALATLGALIRGIVIFLRTKEEELRGGAGPSLSSQRQNKAMMADRLSGDRGDPGGAAADADPLSAAGRWSS